MPRIPFHLEIFQVLIWHARFPFDPVSSAPGQIPSWHGLWLCAFHPLLPHKAVRHGAKPAGSALHLWDFASGIAVFAFGYNNQAFNDALKAQIDKLLHTSNYYYNEPALLAAEGLAKASGMNRVFFTNSGAEAIEGAIKAARKYAYLKDGSTDHEIIAMEHSFHGRTMGALAVTGKKAYREAFEPLIGNVKFANLNDIESVKAQITDKTCAILMETVQGEGGIYPATEEFLKGVRALCDENDILLILDEIQCGMGRTGKMFAWQNYEIKPDIMTCAKAFGCGVPVGAFLMTQKVADKSLCPGDHGTTYGGNPFVGAAVKTVFEQFDKLNITEHVKEIAAYLEAELDKIVEKFDCITTRRGMGLIQGLECTLPVAKVASEALNHGLIVITAGSNVIRFVPPLVIEKSDVDEMIEKCGLKAEFKKKIGQLSKGYRQRVGLAATMIHNPQVLILDEPTTGLDPNQLVEIRELIKDFGRDRTVLFSTHIMQEVSAICDRFLVLKKGVLVADRPTNKITSEELEVLFRELTS